MDGIYYCGRNRGAHCNRAVIRAEPGRDRWAGSKHFFVLGTTAFIQCLLGHRLPINESPAGLWWGVYTIYSGLTGTVFATHIETLQGLQGAMLLSAVFFFIFSLFKVIDKLAVMFTPVVTGIYLLLLVIQLSDPIVKGVMGIGYRKNEVDIPVFLLAVVVMLATFLMSRSNIPVLKQYSILIALFGGWVLFAVFGVAKAPEHANQLFRLPDIFPFGMPLFDSGLVVTSLFITVLLIVNMLASIRVVEGAVRQFEKLEERRRARPAGFIASVSHLLSGLLGAVGTVPISGAAGFIQTTNVFEKTVFAREFDRDRHQLFPAGHEYFCQPAVSGRLCGELRRVFNDGRPGICRIRFL